MKKFQKINFDEHANAVFNKYGVKVSGKRLEDDYVNFLKEHPYDDVIKLASEFESRSAAEDVSLMIESIENSLKNKTGFSFVRMGDGEGRFISGFDNYEEIKKFSVEISKNIWFSNSDLPNFPEWSLDLSRCYENASMVGYCPVFRVKLDEIWYGYYGVVCGNYFIKNKFGLDKFQRLVRNWTHVHLLDDIKFLDLLKKHKIAVIGCHSLDDIRESNLFGDVVSVINIPPQPGFGLKNFAPIGIKLYPDLFEDIRNKITTIDADIVICSAGVHAKFFCEDLRSCGKIGIDFGSEIDKRLGFKTRGKI